jgi:hypothetical protein
MNSVDSDISLDNLAAIIDPFLKALGRLHNGELKERIIDQLFHPLLENNKTQVDETDDEEYMAQ